MMRSRRAGIRLALAGLSISVAVTSMAATAALAQDLETLGNNGSWKAYAFKKGGDTVCYMASAPTRHEGNYTQRGDIYVLVTNDPTENMRGEISFVTGYTYKQESTVSVTIGGATFELETDGDRAWTRGPEDDLAMVSAMVKGTDMIVRGTSSRGTDTKDTYSLIGFTATKKIIDRTCPE